MEYLEQKTFSIPPDELFYQLIELLKEKFEIKRIEESIRSVEISTGMSLFSFGESFEIVVSNFEQGSVVRIKGKSKIKWNITNDAKEKISEIFELLDEQT